MRIGAVIKMNAYVTLVMKGDFYIPGALALAHSLRKTNTRNAIVCMVTDDVVNVPALDAVFDKVVLVDYIRGDHHPFPNDATLHKYAAWENVVLTQHRCLGLFDYAKVCFLDSDVVVLRNMDSVFELEAPAGTFYESIPTGREKHSDRTHGEVVPAEYIMDCLKQNKYLCIANCLLLTPGEAVYEQFLSFLKRFYTENGQKFGFKGWNAHANEQMITYFYCHELAVDWKFIGLSYQCVPWKYVDPDVPPFLHHFLGRVKPWEEPANKYTHTWCAAARQCIKAYPHLKSLFNIEKRGCLLNVADCRPLNVPGEYRFFGNLDTFKSLGQKIRHMNTCTAIKTMESMGEGARVVDGPLGLGVFQASIEGKALISLHEELTALFKDPKRYHVLDAFEAKADFVALFWPQARGRVVSMEEGLTRLRAVGMYDLSNALELTYVPLIMRVLELPLESVMGASVEVIFYRANASTGLEQHVDNVNRTQGRMGPVCSIGFGGSKCIDLLPSGRSTIGIPLRLRTFPGEMMVLDSEARIGWSHCIPYGCDYERYSVVIRPCEWSPTRKIRFDSVLRVSVSEPSPAIRSASFKRTGQSSSFTMYRVPMMLFTAEESRYITWPWNAYTRNRHIEDILRGSEEPVVWDVYAGVGGDTVQLACSSLHAVVHAIQIKTSTGRVERLRRNVKPFGPRCVVYECSAADYIRRQTTGCDLLYLDPPWLDTQFRIVDAVALASRLTLEVFKALAVTVGVICLKTVHGWTELSLPHAELDRTIRADGRVAYFFHFFRLNDQTDANGAGKD
jgi:hypothetical protein